MNKEQQKRGFGLPDKDEKMSRSKQNWVEKLEPDDTVIDDNGKPMVLLRGLRRLARLAGMNGSSIVLSNVHIGERGVIQCVYTALFDDGTSWSGSADCNKSNCEEPYLNYPTAVAESRAAARCLKDALGISMLSAEEIGFDDSSGPKPTDKIDQQVVRLLEISLKRKNMDTATLFRNILTKERLEQVVDLKDLTTTEGQAAVKCVNEAKKVSSPGAARDVRKAQLEAQLKDKQNG